MEPRDDDVLPDSLGDALSKASAATCAAIAKGGVTRCLVEILLPAFWDPASGAVFSEEGDQQRFWKLTRRFIEDLAQAYPGDAPRVRALYPDIGVASMLKNQWQDDVGFQIAAVNDREPVAEDDDLVVLAAPDPQSLDKVMQVVRTLENQRPVVLFNPRLASGDVGIGLNVRRMRDKFLGSFTTTYSLRPVGDDLGSVFRQWPELWKVFVADADAPGRFRLAAERGSRPAGDALDAILNEAMGGDASGGGGEGGEGPGLLAQVRGTVASLQRFMRSLSQ
ncbi:hypothetical protein WJX81_004435 [Elliptochloris bilobata]|uniref:DUF1995 domain-containing protein n=1 Tax=Elliptochloris bilobata TaxID=381761 RepID=A0AAW1RQM1_9CHLO